MAIQMIVTATNMMPMAVRPTEFITVAISAGGCTTAARITPEPKTTVIMNSSVPIIVRRVPIRPAPGIREPSVVRSIVQPKPCEPVSSLRSVNAAKRLRSEAGSGSGGGGGGSRSPTCSTSNSSPSCAAGSVPAAARRARSLAAARAAALACR